MAASGTADGSPIEVVQDGNSYWPWDGFHRIQAAMRAGITVLDANIRTGTLEDARWLSYGANPDHGLRPTRDDRRRAVDAALQHPFSAGKSDEQIARHCRVDGETVRLRRKALEASSEIRKIDTRTAVRNGKPYQINTANIGKQKQASPTKNRLQ